MKIIFDLEGRRVPFDHCQLALKPGTLTLGAGTDMKIHGIGREGFDLVIHWEWEPWTSYWTPE